MSLRKEFEKYFDDVLGKEDELNIVLDSLFEEESETFEEKIEQVQKEMKDGFIGGFKSAPNPYEYGSKAEYRNLTEGIVYKKNLENLWEAYIKDGKDGATPKVWPTGGGLGDKDVKKIIDESITNQNSFISTKKVLITSGATTSNPQNAPLEIVGSVDDYLQLEIQNKSSGTNSSTDIVATSDNGNDSVNYINLGINGSHFSQSGWSVNTANDGYLYVQGGDLSIGTSSPNTYTNFFAGGTSSQNVVATISTSGISSIGPIYSTNLPIPAPYFGILPTNTPEDNYAGFLRAINSNTQIQLLDGVYQVSQAIQISKNLSEFSIIGLGRTRSVISFGQSANGNGFWFGTGNYNYNNILFKDLGITSTAILSSYGTNYGLICPSSETAQIQNFKIIGCDFSCSANASNAIKCVCKTGSSIIDFVVDDCDFHDVSRAGIEIWSPVTSGYVADGLVVKNSRFERIGIKCTNLVVAESLAISIVTSTGKIEISNNRFKNLHVDAGGINGSAIEASGEAHIHDNRFDQSLQKFTSILVSNNNRGVRLDDNRDVGITTYGGFNWKVYNSNGPIIFKGNRIRGTIEFRGGKNIYFLENEMDTITLGSPVTTNLLLDKNFMGLDTSRTNVINCGTSGHTNIRITNNTIKCSGGIVDNPSNLTSAVYSFNIVNDIYIP